MKKTLLLLLATSFLTACGSEETAKPKEEQKEEVKSEDELSQAEWMEQQEKKENKEKTEDEKPLSEQSDGEHYEEGFGNMKAIGAGYNDEVGIDGTDAPIKPIKMGPMELYINKVGVIDVEPDEDAKEMLFNGQDKARAVIVDMKATNTSEEDITFHPNQAIIVTDTGEQVESEMMLMGNAGGDFLGKVTKEGQTWWLLKNLDKDVKNLTLIISPPSNTETWEDIGEEKRIEFEVLSWEEAKKKDEQ